MKNLKILIILIFAVCSNPIQAQDQTMYFMKGLYQTTHLNPAFQDNYTVHIGIPGISSYQTGMQFRNFNASDFLENVNNLENVVDRLNTIAFYTNADLFSLGLRGNKWGFTFDMTQRVDGQIDLAGDFLLFASQGNEDFIGKTANFNNTGFNFTLYHEYAFGYSRKILPFITIGARVKILRGQVALKTENWEMGLYTAPETFDLEINSNVRMLASAPLEFIYKENEEGRIDDLEVVDRNSDEYFNHYLFNNKNKGTAFDFGVVATPIPKMTFTASLCDLGSIKWKQDVWEISQNGNFTFSGIDLEPYTDTLGSEDYEPIEELLDSLGNEFKVMAGTESFRTTLTSRLYMGASYDLTKKITAGFLSATAFYNEKTRQSFTLSGNTQFSRWFSLTGSYTWCDYAPANAGIGVAMRAGPFQFHFIANNLLGLRIDPKHHYPWPAYSQNLDFRFGFNLRLYRIVTESPIATQNIVR
jgi:hypothetical protein